MDAAVLPDLRRQRRAPSAACPRVQYRQFHAHAGDAEDGAAVVADQPAREVDQDRREGRPPRPLRDLPAGRGRGAATDVRRNPVADRSAARTARARMIIAGSTAPGNQGEKYALEQVNQARFSVGVPQPEASTALCPW